MVSTEYLTGRTKWSRPQAMIWSDVPFSLVNGAYVPVNVTEGTDFIIITDHNRSDISLSPTRIESRSRMINGTSRSYFTADKTRLSTSWSMLPSRIAVTPVQFDALGHQIAGGEAYVADNASAAIDLIDWYETHPHSFYVYLSYDKGPQYDQLATIAAGGDPNIKVNTVGFSQYTTMKKMFFDSFSNSLRKRGIYDMWDIDVSLDEV